MCVILIRAVQQVYARFSDVGEFSVKVVNVIFSWTDYLCASCCAVDRFCNLFIFA